ncbi:alpha/beta hydrolase [Streptomyces sp. NPDC001142]
MAEPEEQHRPAPPVDPELAGPLEEILRRRPPSLLPEMIHADRKRIAAMRLGDAEIERNGVFTGSTVELSERDASGQVSLLIVRPTGAVGLVPVAYNIHGGGMVAGHNRSAELLPELDRAQELGMAVVSVNYRLAPEHPDPVPVEDCYAGLTWLMDHGPDWGLDPGRVFLTGASAGAALAAGVALMVRDRHNWPLRGQLLLCPMFDDLVTSDSSRQMSGRGVWDSVSSVTGWTALLGERRGGADVSAYAAPARAASLSGLAPAYVEVGTYEALRDEALEYGRRLALAGGDVELHMWGGAFHSFDEWVPEARVSGTARRARADWILRHLPAA